MTTSITDARVIELARRFEEYPGSSPTTPTLRGGSIVEFARVLLDEQAIQFDERVSQLERRFVVMAEKVAALLDSTGKGA